jgi:K+/H+ antiporter YhaU regulatory subunit KhtT
MIGIITLLIVLILSFLVTRVATIALTHTGLSKQTAKFQSRSAFTGVGYTTSESERVVNHPLRRKILLILMLVGNAGIITVISSLIISFVQTDGGGGTLWLRIVVLVAGVVALWSVSNSAWVERRLSKLINRLLKKTSALDIADYSGLLHLSGEYKISEIPIDEGHWLTDTKIRESELRDEGVIVLAVNRKDGSFIGAPQADTVIRENDSIIVYGRAPVLQDLEKRDKGQVGNIAHKASVEQQQKIVDEEKKKDVTA